MSSRGAYSPIVYQLEWCGFWSDVLVLCGLAFFASIIVLLGRVIFKAVRDANQNLSSIGGSGLAFSNLGVVAAVLAIAFGAVFVGLLNSFNGDFLAASEGAVKGYARSKDAGRRMLFAISLIGIPLILVVVVRGIFCEEPVALLVTTQQIKLVYRLPWRNYSISMANVRHIALEHKEYRESGGFKADGYEIVLEHDGILTRIHSSDRPWYKDQLRAAFGVIQNAKEDLIH